MVLQVMDALSRLPGVDVLRAPYEADAQLLTLTLTLTLTLSLTLTLTYPSP